MTMPGVLMFSFSTSYARGAVSFQRFVREIDSILSLQHDGEKRCYVRICGI